KKTLHRPGRLKQCKRSEHMTCAPVTVDARDAGVTLERPTGDTVHARDVPPDDMDLVFYGCRDGRKICRFSLVVDVAPHSHLHVYAPGAEASGYRVISLTLQSNPRIHVLSMKYPASEIYYFKPLKERVPVFQKPFRLTQELLLDGTPASQEA